MIFMVCGTQKFPLNRMLEQMDYLLKAGVVTQEVFAQTGYSDYEPKHYRWSRFLDGEEFEEKIKNCTLLLTHSGVGTILTGKEYGKPVLVYPRSGKYGEHVDDHQWQIAREFREREYVLVCEDVSEMGEKIRLCETFAFRELHPTHNVQVNVIRDFLQTKQPVRG